MSKSMLMSATERCELGHEIKREDKQVITLIMKSRVQFFKSTQSRLDEN